MTNIIPQKLIEHLEWTPGSEKPKKPEVAKAPIISDPIIFSIDDILNGTTFFSDKKDKKGNYIGLAVALQEALSYAGKSGMVANLSEFIAAKAKADKEHVFWNNGYDVHTEENIGIDKKGVFYAKNDPVLVIVNGGGILNPERILKAYADGLIDNSAKYTEQEFSALLEGKLPDGTNIPMYQFEDIKDGKSGLPHKFGVVMPYSMAQATKSGYHQKTLFMENPLVIARAAGGLDYLEAYYEKAKDSVEDVGNHHPFEDRDASVPRGRVLFVNSYFGGLDGDYDLNYDGRFVGVAPEAPAARKRR